MTPSMPVSCFLSQSLAFLAFISVTLGAISLVELLDTFNVEMRENTGGSCDRDVDLEVATPMLPKVLAAFDDAWLLAAFGLEVPQARISGSEQNPQSFVRVQELLFVWFGISIADGGIFNSLDDATAFAFVKGRSISYEFEHVRVSAYSSQN